jgi:hypothetical protein
MTSLRPLFRIALIQFIATLSLCTLAGSALAQAPAAAVPAKADCAAKPTHPGRLASDTQRRVWQKEANEYLACYKKYVLVKQQAAQDMAKAANDAIDEYNATVKEFEDAKKDE